MKRRSVEIDEDELLRAGDIYPQFIAAEEGQKADEIADNVAFAVATYQEYALKRKWKVRTIIGVGAAAIGVYIAHEATTSSDIPKLPQPTVVSSLPELDTSLNP